jgi:hypothetical protein
MRLLAPAWTDIIANRAPAGNGYRSGITPPFDCIR